MDNIPVTDQWKLNGECAKCRRNNYCNKDCTAARKHRERIMEQVYRDVLKEKYPEFAKVLEEIPRYDGQKIL